MTIKLKKTVIRKMRELADYVERRHRSKPKSGYDQTLVTHDCGAPACMRGHGDVLFGDKGMDQLRRAVKRLDCFTDIFGAHGCDDAQRNWRKAAKFVRDWCDEREAV